MPLHGDPSSAALDIWRFTLRRAGKDLLPFLERNLPELAPLALKAFAWPEPGVAPTTRTDNREAWRRLRTPVLSLSCEFRHKPDGTCLCETVGHVLVEREGQEKVVRYATSERLDWRDVPAALREAFTRAGESGLQLEVMKVLDRQFDEGATSD